jgi:hypothetical protein
MLELSLYFQKYLEAFLWTIICQVNKRGTFPLVTIVIQYNAYVNHNQIGNPC